MVTRPYARGSQPQVSGFNPIGTPHPEGVILSTEPLSPGSSLAIIGSEGEFPFSTNNPEPRWIAGGCQSPVGRRS